MTDLLTLTSLLIYAINVWNMDIIIAHPINFPLGHTAYMGSMYLTVLLTLVRCLAVCWKKHFTIKKTKLLIASIFLFVTIYNLPKWMIFKWETNQKDVTELKTTELACNLTFYKVYFAGGDGFFGFILPTFILVTSNILMYKKVQIVDILKSDLPVLNNDTKNSEIRIGRGNRTKLLQISLIFNFKLLACFICFTQKFSVMGRREISIMECTDKNFCVKQMKQPINLVHLETQKAPLSKTKL